MVLQSMLGDPIVHEMVRLVIKSVSRKAMNVPIPVSPIALGVMVFRASCYGARRILTRRKACKRLKERLPDVRLYISRDSYSYVH